MKRKYTIQSNEYYGTQMTLDSYKVENYNDRYEKDRSGVIITQWNWFTKFGIVGERL